MFQILRQYILDKYKVDILDNSSRKKELVSLRACTANILYEYFDMSLTDIAAQWGQDHTTVLHHVRKHPDKYLYDFNYADIYDDLKMFIFKDNPYLKDSLGEIIKMLDTMQG